LNEGGHLSALLYFQQGHLIKNYACERATQKQEYLSTVRIQFTQVIDKKLTISQ